MNILNDERGGCRVKIRKSKFKALKQSWPDRKDEYGKDGWGDGLATYYRRRQNVWVLLWIQWESHGGN